MSVKIAYLINPHEEGGVSDSALDKALNALQPAQNVEQVGTKKETSSDNTIAEKVRARLRKKARQKN